MGGNPNFTKGIFKVTGRYFKEWLWISLLITLYPNKSNCKDQNNKLNVNLLIINRKVGKNPKIIRLRSKNNMSISTKINAYLKQIIKAIVIMMSQNIQVLSIVSCNLHQVQKIASKHIHLGRNVSLVNVENAKDYCCGGILTESLILHPYRTHDSRDLNNEEGEEKLRFSTITLESISLICTFVRRPDLNGVMREVLLRKSCHWFPLAKTVALPGPKLEDFSDLCTGFPFNQITEGKTSKIGSSRFQVLNF